MCIYWRSHFIFSVLSVWVFNVFSNENTTKWVFPTYGTNGVNPSCSVRSDVLLSLCVSWQLRGQASVLQVQASPGWSSSAWLGRDALIRLSQGFFLLSRICEFCFCPRRVKLNLPEQLADVIDPPPWGSLRADPLQSMGPLQIHHNPAAKIRTGLPDWLRKWNFFFS